jgi:hypothetical protein
VGKAVDLMKQQGIPLERFCPLQIASVAKSALASDAAGDCDMNGRIRLGPEITKEDQIWHEIAHHVDGWMQDREWHPLARWWMNWEFQNAKDALRLGAVSVYGLSNPQEWWAESFRFYFEDRTRLEKCPCTIRLIESLIVS